jgi:hypothetical protein
MYTFRVAAPPAETHAWLRGRAEKSGEGVEDGVGTAFTVAWRGNALATSDAPAVMQVEIDESGARESVVTVTVESDAPRPLEAIKDYAGPLGDRLRDLKPAGQALRDARGLTAKVAIADLPRKVRKAAQDHITAGEPLDFAFWGPSHQTIVAFRDRVLILKPGLMANASFGCRATTIFYRDITGVQVNTGMVMGVLEISTPSYQARPVDYWQAAGSGRDARAPSAYVIPNCIPCSKDQIRRWQPFLEELRRRVASAKGTGSVAPVAASPPPSSAAPVSTPKPLDPLDQIRRLAELRDAGIVTDAEFAAKKAELLERI